MNAHANEIAVANSTEIQASPAPPAPVSEGAAIISMIERAARDPAVDIEKFERLMAMRERMEARAAKIAFDEAIATAKSLIGPIIKNREVDFTSAKGRTNYKFEDFSAIARAVDPALSKLGVHYRFRTDQQGQRVRVTCILSRGGYSEETTLESAEDHSGNKNVTQAIGSVVTYLQRYTLKAALGLAVSHDDDAQSAMSGARPCLEPEDAAYVRQLIAETNSDETKFLAAFKIASIEDLSPDDYKRAIDMLNRKRANGVQK